MITASLFFIASAMWYNKNKFICYILGAIAIFVSTVKIMQAFGV